MKLREVSPIWTKNVDCGCCDAHLVVEETDLRYKTKTYGDNPFQCFCVECMVCGTGIRIYEDELSVEMANRVKALA